MTDSTLLPAKSEDLFRAADEILAQLANLHSTDPCRLELRDRLIRLCAPLAQREAARYRRTRESADDLKQVAMVGLILAIDRFDASRHIAFRHFARPTITGELKRHFRDQSWSVRVSRQMQEISLELRAREPELTQRLGRPPDQAELAAALGISERDVAKGRIAASVHNAQSLNAPLFDDGEATELGDTLGGPDAAIEAIADRDALRRALQQLPKDLAEILALRFVDELTQAQIAEKVSTSQMQVSRRISRALALLRRHMMAERPTGLADPPHPTM